MNCASSWTFRPIYILTTLSCLSPNYSKILHKCKLPKNTLNNCFQNSHEDIHPPSIFDSRNDGIFECFPGVSELSNASNIQVLQINTGTGWQYLDSRQTVRTPGFYSCCTDVHWFNTIHSGFVWSNMFVLLIIINRCCRSNPVLNDSVLFYHVNTK